MDQGRLRILLWIVAVGFFMQTLDSTIVNTALPSMARSLGESPLEMHSVVIAYSLTMAMLIPASGWLADRFGARSLFMAAIVLFVAGSLACAMSGSLMQLVCARVVQGAGGAMLLPVGRLVVLRNVPRTQFLEAMSFVAIPGLIGPLIGPTLGGWLVQVASWHWIFLINVPVGVVGCIATYLFMPDNRASAVGRFDLVGYCMLSVAMVALSFSLEGLTQLGMPRATVLVLLIFAFALIVAYGFHAQRKPSPLFPLHLFHIHTFSVGLLGNLFARIGSGAMPFLIPLLLQVVLARSPMEAGLMMLPVAAAGMSAKRVVTPLIRRFGYRRVLVSNTLLLGALMASFALISADEPLIVRIIHLGAYGALNSIQFTSMNTVTLRDLDSERAGSGNSLFSMVQMLSMSLGVTIAGALLTAFTSYFGTSSPAATLAAFRSTFVCIGAITCASAWIFWQLSPDIRGGSDRPEAGDAQ
ncbi:DHA2 family efflux MFS transporter permease subunit [Phreatobacter aquaticus]|uniref:DHA2 family efflux MFS transporter permease subunit n=1 Tax=Phreatobacter aquaticus TaxID=2570229 RepID=A0A4D7QJ17_9HYPH|nr:multidrug transporter subunit MdtD [Phreatobacter aquaticus]QCK87660.1 DHA2 family efflux MFS transporter permease subunit [Phreatobacter aquaticus]